MPPDLLIMALSPLMVAAPLFLLLRWVLRGGLDAEEPPEARPESGTVTAMYGKFRLELTYAPRHRELCLQGPLPPAERALALARQMHEIGTLQHRWGPDPRVWPACGAPWLAVPAARALERLAESDETVLRMQIAKEVDLTEATELACWVAEQLGWDGEGQQWELALEHPDPEVRLNTWQGLLGWQPQRDLGALVRDKLAVALQDSSPWVRAFAALHLDRQDLLKELLVDPKTPDPLVLTLVRRIDPGLSQATWLELLAREPALYHVETREALIAFCGAVLARMGGVELLPELRALSQERSSRGRAAQKAYRAIIARTGAPGGRLAVAEQGAVGGELAVVVDRGGLSVPE